MNYSQEAKREICESAVSQQEPLSLLSAVLHTCGTVCKSGDGLKIRLNSENPHLFPLTDKLMKKLFSAGVVREGREAVISENAAGVLKGCRLMDFDDSGRITGIIAGIWPALIKTEAGRCAYLAGAFLGAGSLSAGSGYHLEIAAATQALAGDLADLLTGFGLSCHCFERKDKFVVYLKRSEDICDFLSRAGATRTMLELTERLARNKARKDANGRNNLELSNMDRTINVAVEQAEAVRLILKRGGADALDAKLKEVALLRIEDESLSYEDMAVRLGVSKGSVKYRLGKIMLEAAKYGLPVRPKR